MISRADPRARPVLTGDARWMVVSVEEAMREFVRAGGGKALGRRGT